MRFYPITIRTPQGTTQTFFVRAGSEAEARAEAERLYGGQLGTGENQTQIVTIGEPQNEIPTGTPGRGAVGIMEPGGDVTRFNPNLAGMNLEPSADEFFDTSIRGEGGTFQRAFDELFPNIATPFRAGIRASTFSPLKAIGDVGNILQNRPLEGLGGAVGALRNIGPQNTARVASDLFQQLISAANNPDTMARPDIGFQSLVNPTFSGGAFREDGAVGARRAFDLARAAAANTLGAFTANQLLPSGNAGFNRLTSEFSASDMLPEQGGYLRFLQQRFGL